MGSIGSLRSSNSLQGSGNTHVLTTPAPSPHPAPTPGVNTHGLNAPGLVPAKKVKSTSTGFGKDFEEIRDRTNFWSSKGIMDSVPKVKGIITPKGSGAGQKPMK